MQTYDIIPECEVMQNKVCISSIWWMMESHEFLGSAAVREPLATLVDLCYMLVCLELPHLEGGQLV
jgi:hypothetical protein